MGDYITCYECIHVALSICWSFVPAGNANVLHYHNITKQLWNRPIITPCKIELLHIYIINVCIYDVGGDYLKYISKYGVYCQSHNLKPKGASEHVAGLSEGCMTYGVTYVSGGGRGLGPCSTCSRGLALYNLMDSICQEAMEKQRV